MTRSALIAAHNAQFLSSEKLSAITTQRIGEGGGDMGEKRAETYASRGLRRETLSAITDWGGGGG